MPLYDYRCEECATVFEQRRSIAEMDRAAVCPTCSSLLTQRILTAASLVGGTRLAETTQPAASGKAHRAGCACCTPVIRR
jgi:putative FmdB family regulatory protein